MLVDQPEFLKEVERLRIKWKIAETVPYSSFTERWMIPLAGESKDEEFLSDVGALRNLFRRPDTFDKVISYAIVCGVIPEGIYRTTYWEIDPDNQPYLAKGDFTRAAIFVTPQSTDDDVLKTFRLLKKNLFKDPEWYPLAFTEKTNDTLSSIKQTRDWYWLNHPSAGLKRKGYLKIADDFKVPRNTVVTAIRDYKEFLTKHVGLGFP